MSVTLPSELTWVLNILGFMWPEADEDKLKVSAQAWRDFGAEVVRINQDARLVAARVTSDNSGESIDSFERYWNGVGGPGGDFERAKEAADHMAAALDGMALLVEGVKGLIIFQLGLLAAEIIADQIAAPETLGASEALMAGEIIVTRGIVRRIIQEGIRKVGQEIVHGLKGRVLEIFRRILATALRRAVVGATVAGGLDIAKQEVDIHVFHSRTRFDGGELATVAGTGGLLGAVIPGRRAAPRVTEADRGLVSRPSKHAGTGAVDAGASNGVVPGPRHSLLPGELDVGTYKDLIDAGATGDNVTPHHIPSASFMEAHGADSERGATINMEQPTPGTGGRHRLTFTYGTQADADMTPRSALASGVMDARRIYADQGLYSPEVRHALQKLISLNKALFPDLFR